MSISVQINTHCLHFSLRENDFDFHSQDCFWMIEEAVLPHCNWKDILMAMK